MGDQYEQDFEAASAEYEHYNSTLKIELPQFLSLSTRFIDPLFHSFYFMQCALSSVSHVPSSLSISTRSSPCSSPSPPLGLR